MAGPNSVTSDGSVLPGLSAHYDADRGLLTFRSSQNGVVTQPLLGIVSAPSTYRGCGGIVLRLINEIHESTLTLIRNPLFPAVVRSLWPGAVLIQGTRGEN